MEAVTLDQAVERAHQEQPDGRAGGAGHPARRRAAAADARGDDAVRHREPQQRCVNSTERRFDDVVTSPRTQATLSAQFGMPVLAASRWAATAQARDQVEIANLSTADVRTNIAVATAQAYLAIIALKREVEVTQRAHETSLAHLDYARRRLEAGRRHAAQRAARRSGSRHQRGAARDGAARRSPRAGGARRADRRRMVRSTRLGDPVFDIPTVDGRSRLDGAASRRAAVHRGGTRGRSRVARQLEGLVSDGHRDRSIRRRSCRRASSRSARSWRFVVTFSQPDLRWRPAAWAEARRARPTSTRRGWRCTGLQIQARSEVRVAQETVAQHGARARQPALGGPAGGRSAEDHDVRVRSRRDDEPRSDRRAASGARRGYSGRGSGTRGATGPARSAHRAGAVPAVSLRVSPQRRDDATTSFERIRCAVASLR